MLFRKKKKKRDIKIYKYFLAEIFSWDFSMGRAKGERIWAIKDYKINFK